jgi:hypothetical protein
MALLIALSASIVPLTEWQGWRMGCLAASVKHLRVKDALDTICFSCVELSEVWAVTHRLVSFVSSTHR